MDSIGVNHNYSLDEINKISGFPNESRETDFDTIVAIMSLAGSPSYNFVDSLYNDGIGISFDSAITMMYNASKINLIQKAP